MLCSSMTVHGRNYNSSLLGGGGGWGGGAQFVFPLGGVITRAGMQRSKCASLHYLSRLFYFILVTKYILQKVLLLVTKYI